MAGRKTRLQRADGGGGLKAPPPTTTTSTAIDKRVLMCILLAMLVLCNWYRSSQTVGVSSCACHSLQQEKATTSKATIKKKILWIATCETREDSEDLNFLYKTVTAFQVRNNHHYNNTSSAVDNDDKITHHVAFKNVCAGLPWNGPMTKFQATLRFASSLMEMQYIRSVPSVPTPTVLTMMTNSYRFSDWSDRMDEIEQVVADSSKTSSSTTQLEEEEHYIMFVDADTFINTWSTETTKNLFQTFDQVSNNSTKVVIGGEPTCWVGDHCHAEHFEQYFPQVKAATSCAVFVNSGCYMGRLPQIWKMVLDLTIMKNVNPPGFDTLRNLKNDDQGRAAVWYANHRNEAVMDHSGKIFRNLMFGLANHNNPHLRPHGRWHCGPNNKCGRNDGYYHGRTPEENATGWTFDSRRKAIAFRQVVDCETEPYPFLIHGNGDSKSIAWVFRNLIAQNHTFD